MGTVLHSSFMFSYLLLGGRLFVEQQDTHETQCVLCFPLHSFKASGSHLDSELLYVLLAFWC